MLAGQKSPCNIQNQFILVARDCKHAFYRASILKLARGFVYCRCVGAIHIHTHNSHPIKELNRIQAYISETNIAMDKWKTQLDSAH
jgi:hypothetical protein